MVSNHIKLWPASLQLDKQSVQVPGTKRPGQTGTLSCGQCLHSDDEPMLQHTIEMV